MGVFGDGDRGVRGMLLGLAIELVAVVRGEGWGGGGGGGGGGDRVLELVECELGVLFDCACNERLR